MRPHWSNKLASFPFDRNNPDPKPFAFLSAVTGLTPPSIDFIADFFTFSQLFP
jgi:hypothetical protein